MALITLFERLHGLVRVYWPSFVFGLILIRLLLNKYGRKLNSIPGPCLAGFTDLWRFFDACFATPHETHLRLHRRMNSHFVRIGPRVVSISDPTLIPTIYGINSGFTKTEFYTLSMLPFEGTFMPSLFNTRDERYHSMCKKPIANAYSMSTMVEFEPLVDSTTSLLMTKLDGFATSGVSFDLGVWLQMYAFDVIGELLFSQKLGFLSSGTDVQGIMADIRVKIGYAGRVGQIPILDRILTKNPIFLRLAPTHPIVTFTLARMKERDTMTTGAGIQKPDFLARCFEAQAKFPDVVTDRMILVYNSDNVGAGSDTTAISLRAIFYYLLKSPSSMRKLVTEIDIADREGRLSDFVTWQESTRLPYLQACIKEALRMHPAVGLLLERYVPKGGISLAGHYFPEGTILGINPWVTARDREVYGADADFFRPERWLEASDEQLLAMERSNLVFGYGNRACIGKNISLLEISKLVPQLLRHYKFSFAFPNLDWKVAGGWFVWQDGFQARISRRTDKPVA
ncbi:Cytochrome P450 monooxygenase cicH [Exophiala dermatitidis]